MQKFSQFYVLYRNTVQFEHNLWKLDCFEKSVLELMADPVVGRSLVLCTYKRTHFVSLQKTCEIPKICRQRELDSDLPTRRLECTN